MLHRVKIIALSGCKLESVGLAQSAVHKSGLLYTIGVQPPKMMQVGMTMRVLEPYDWLKSTNVN